VAYALSSGKTLFRSPDGGIETLSMDAGKAVFRPSETHGHQNIGTESASVLVFELKTHRCPGPAPKLPEPDLLKVAPRFCNVLLDNARCRLLDIRFSAGQSLGVHATLDQIVCPLIDGMVRVTYPDGIPKVMTLEQGKPFFVESTVVNEENIGRSDVHVVKLDLKP
jgi:hypothetical protein